MRDATHSQDKTPERRVIAVIAERYDHIRRLMDAHCFLERRDWFYVRHWLQLPGMKCVLWVYSTAKKRRDYQYLMDYAQAARLPIMFVDD